MTNEDAEHFSKEILTIREWQEKVGIIVYDPDGFDRTDPNLMSNKYTYEEFMTGVLSSTCMVKNKDFNNTLHDFYMTNIYNKEKEN